MLFEKPDRLA